MSVYKSYGIRIAGMTCMVQKRLEPPVDCNCMEINLGCSRFIYSILTAMRLMNSSDM